MNHRERFEGFFLTHDIQEPDGEDFYLRGTIRLGNKFETISYIKYLSQPHVGFDHNLWYEKVEHTVFIDGLIEGEVVEIIKQLSLVEKL